MTKLVRLKCLILISITISFSYGLPKNESSLTTSSEYDYVFEEMADITTVNPLDQDNLEANETDTLVNSSDEANNKVSEKMCQVNEFKCLSDSEMCIRKSWRCDGENDCRDGSDEKNCFDYPQTACGFGGFICQDDSDRCIRKSWICDGEDDCGDGSDEKNCYSHKLSSLPDANCPPGEFMCQDDSQRCIRSSWRCDNEYDCKDGSDEKDCFSKRMGCPSSEFMCLDDSSRCIHGSWRCDGTEDCADGSDEKNCFVTDLEEPEQNIYNILDSLNENITDYTTLEELTSIIELLVNEQEAGKARSSLGCPLDIKQKLAECSGKCREISCFFKELQSFMAACRSGTKQSCNEELVNECQLCGIANTAETRSNVKNANRGRPTWQRLSTPTRIVGGVEVSPPRKYPWQVIIQTENVFCGGSIINKRWILTAGQCVDPSLQQQVLVGMHNLNLISDDNPDGDGIRYHVKRQVIHPEYEHTKAQPYNDFGLLELTADIQFDNDIRPVCLPGDDTNSFAGVMATISGWGDTVDSDGVYTEQDVLMEVDVPIDANADCKGWNKTLFNTKPINESQLCAGPVIMDETYKDACVLDTGGPLVVKEGERYIQVGILSYGGLCFYYANNPSIFPTLSTIYSRVSKELDWIRKTTASGTCL